MTASVLRPGQLPGWLTAARERHHFDPRGSLGLIDPAAALRGVAAVRTGTAIPIGRSLPPPGEIWVHENGIYTSAYDRVSIECHGTEITHVDALNHFGLYSSFYGTARPEPSDGVDIGTLAQGPIVTRAILLDLAAEVVGGCITADRPVQGLDLQRALDDAAVEVLPGDAMLLYMGRDRLEAAGGAIRSAAESPDGRPGVGDDGARWLSALPLGVLGWDLLDAHPPGELGFPVHALSWAIGLVLIDNCALAGLRAALADREQHTGLLVASPLALAGGTGCAVNPVVVL